MTQAHPHTGADAPSGDGARRTVVHLLRHGEVDNPRGILYGRLPGYHLSGLGREMAQRVADHLVGHDIGLVTASSLTRAQETATPIARSHDLPVHTDDRIIEAGNRFEGQRFGHGEAALSRPGVWWLLRNPFRPSWGEPYERIADRMVEAIDAARHAVHEKYGGGEVVLVSHQLPIWTTRLFLEKRSYLHHPKNRQCTLCSVTSVVYDDDAVVQVRYSEPAGDLIPVADRSAPFSAGGAPREDRP